MIWQAVHCSLFRDKMLQLTQNASRPKGGMNKITLLSISDTVQNASERLTKARVLDFICFSPEPQD